MNNNIFPVEKSFDVFASHTNNFKSKLTHDQLIKFMDSKLKATEKHGIPQPIEEFLEQAYGFIMQKGELIQRMVAERLLSCCQKMKVGNFWKKTNDQTKASLEMFIHAFKACALDDYIGLLGIENFEILSQIHLKLMTLVAEKMAGDLQLGKQEWTLVKGQYFPQQDQQMAILYFQRQGNWLAASLVSKIGNIDTVDLPQMLLEPIINDDLGIPRKYVLMGGQEMLFEKDFFPVNEKRIIVEITEEYSGENLQASTLLPGLLNDLSAKKKSNLLLIIQYYTGMPDLDSWTPNCIKFEAKITPGNLDVQSIRLRSPNQDLVHHYSKHLGAYTDMIKTYQAQAAEIIEDFKEEWVDEFRKSGKDGIYHSFAWPKNSAEWKRVEWEVLEELSQEPEKNAGLIEWIAEELEPAFKAEEVKQILTEEQIKDLENGETLDANPEMMCKALLNHAGKEYQAEMLAPKESNNNSTGSMKAEVVMQDEWAKHRHLGKNKPHKKDKKAVKAKEKEEATSTPAVKPQQLKLSKEERGQVQSVMQGHAMRSKDFNKFLIKLLTRKMKESKSKTVNQDGSHTKIHYEGESKVFTFVRKHGKKDSVGFIGQQKKGLKDILNLK